MSSFASRDKENALSNANANSNVLLFSPPAKVVAPTAAGSKQGHASTSRVGASLPVLVTARFQGALYLEFGKVAVNSSSEVQFKLSNPSESKAVTVSVDKVPVDKGFRITFAEGGPGGEGSVEIPGGGVALGTVHWRPQSDMSVREVATLKLMDKSPLQITLHGIAGTGQAVPSEKVSRKALAAIAASVVVPTKAPAPVAVSALPAKKMYDDKWAEKQIESFTEWINFTLDDKDKDKDREDKEAESSGLRLLMQRRLEAQTRQRAMLIFHSSEVTVPLFALGEEICEGRLMVREDRDVHADLGLQETLLGLLFSYELPWLRLGLEVVFGQIISLGFNSKSSNNPKGKKALKAFILEHLFADTDIQAKFPKDKLLYKANQVAMKEQLRAHLVKKFLALVLVIDHAREQRLLSMPKMFAEKSAVKSSKEVLLSFCCDFLRGEGDFIRHLGLMGYHVSFAQTYTDEYDYTVSNLAVDLRDGVRLTRLVEVLTKTSDLSPLLRVPAGSYLQKVHNVKLALSKIYDKAEPMPDPKHIVEGNRDTTLLMLWKLMYGFELKMLIDPTRVRKEAAAIRHNQRWRRSIYGRAEAEQFAVAVPVYDENGGVTFPHPADAEQFGAAAADDDADLSGALLAWCQAVAGQYGVAVYNLTSCLADGRALCMLVHYYHPSILPTKAIKKTTQNLTASFANNTALDMYTESCLDVPKADSQKALTNERKNFATLKRACSDIGGVPAMLPSYDSGNQPEAKTMTVFLGYLFARLIESSEQVRAAIRIQRAYRGCADALRRSFVPKAVKMTAKLRAVQQHHHHPVLETRGVTDVCVTVVMSTHHAANVIKRLVQTFCQRRMYLSFLAGRAAEQAYNQEMQHEEELHREMEASHKARLLAEEAVLAQQREEERLQAIEHEQNLVKQNETERRRLMEMHEETALLAIEEAAAARAEAEAAEEQRQLALEEAENARAEAEAAEALRQEALEEAENARAEAEAEAEAREALEKQLGLYEADKCAAEQQARLLETYRLELERQVSEGSITEAELRMQLEMAQTAKLSAEAEALANYEKRLEALAQIAEEKEAAAKLEELAREAEAARVAQEKLEAVIKAEKDAREAAELEAKVKAEYSHSLELRIKELEASRVAELAAAADAERLRVENETKLSQELALRVEEARIAAEELAQRKVEEEAQIAAAAVQAEREARAAAEAQTKAEATARMAAEAQLRAIEESRLATELEAKRLADEERMLVALRNAASSQIQTVWRQFSASKRHEFQRNMCASIIQSVWRQCRMRRLWRTYNLAATRIQSRWRSSSLHKKFTTMKRSAQTLVRWWKTESARLSLKTSMRDAIRSAMRTASAEAAKEKFHALQYKSAAAIAKWFRIRLLFIRMHKLCFGFRRLQAFYRALCIRRKSNAATKSLRVRIIEAEKRSIADPSLRLGQQTKSSLETLQSGKMISHLLKACQTLELSTQVSTRCCQAFTEAQASSVLFGLIRSCNRSTPHQEILRHALVVLLNVARHAQLAAFVAQSPESTDVLVDLMQMFRDKQPIFSLSCELLGRLAAASEETKSICNSADHKKRLDGILHIIERKHRLDARVKNLGARAAAEFVGSPKGKGRFLAEMDPIHGIQHLFFVLESK